MKSLTLIIALAYLLNLPLSYAEQSIDVDTKAVEYSQAELEQMLAPIALYPDSVLTHILIAATYPLEIIEAERWVSKNPNLSNSELMDKGDKMEWDPSVVALLPFPAILKKLSDELTWTRQLGDAFLSDEEQVLTSIQSLRQKADKAGNLSQMENVDVAREDNNIAITPADPQIVYVPYYDARVVYGPWYWTGYPPVYWTHYPSYYSPHYPAPFYWHTGVHISVGWFFGGFHWGNHHVVVNHHPNSYYYRHYNNHHDGHNSHYRGGKKHYSSGKIHSSKGYQRWQHQPSHRKSISYKNDRVAKQYSSNKPSKNHANAARKQDRKLLALSKYKGSQNGSNYRVLKTNKVTSTRHKQTKQKLDKSSVRNYQYKKNSKVVTNNTSKPTRKVIRNVKANPNRASINKSYNAESNKQAAYTSSKKNRQVSSKSPYTATKSTYKQSTKQYKQKSSKQSYSSPKKHSRASKGASHKSSRARPSRPKH